MATDAERKVPVLISATRVDPKIPSAMRVVPELAVPKVTIHFTYAGNSRSSEPRWSKLFFVRWASSGNHRRPAWKL
jgi:hypothetical protein